MIGLGAMLYQIRGGSPTSPEDFTGRLIVGAELADDELRLTFGNGERIRVWDDGQSCCESRYITTDDDPASLIGGKLLSIEARDGPDVTDDRDECHETAFVEIATDQGFITLTTHNEHNGYYGGFGLSIDKLPPAPTGRDGDREDG